MLGEVLPWSGASAEDADSSHALGLLNSTSCSIRDPLLAQVAQAAPAPTNSPTAEPSSLPLPTQPSPSPGPTPTFANAPSGPTQLYATPRPSESPIGPPPVPTPTPAASPNNSPIMLVRPTGLPKPLTPAGEPTGSPEPSPSAAGPTPIPTLQPGYIAVLADQVSGNTNEGQPGDAIGNVNIFYQDGILVGDRAHYDGKRTMTVTGHPYIINREQNSILRADTIDFDTVTRMATLKNTHGESTQGVEKGEVFYSARDMTSTSGGVAHGNYANLTTCTNPRAGYHLTGRTIDVKPGDRITITKAVLFLGAAAIFYLPRVVIPLHQVDEIKKPTFFPEVGYNSYDGYYVKAKLGFGKDEYYQGYYRVNYLSKAGLGLGYVGFFEKHDHRRKASVDYYGQNDRRQGNRSYNLAAMETEYYSRTLQSQLNFAYNSNFGQFTANIPPTTQINAVVTHATAREQQNYTFARSASGSQNSSYNYAFTDQHQLSQNLSQGISLTLNTSSNNYTGATTYFSTSHINTLTHLTTNNYDYQLTFDKTNANMPNGVNKLPELQIRPNSFFPKLRVPITANFTLGSYQELQSGLGTHNEYTTRADLAFQMGPALYKIFGSDFSAGGSVEQFAYGTGDLKAKIQQNLSLQTPVGKHFVNSLSYTESNYNGPIQVPFQTLDQFSRQNYHSANEVMRFFNSDFYNFQISTGTSFNQQAQPVTYQLTARPRRRTLVILGGYFSPGSGLGFGTTNLQLSTPFGRDGDVQFIADVDWHNHARILNKNIYFHRVIGNCYEIRVQYNENLKAVNVTLDLLAFPSRAATFGVDKNGPILPGGLNL